MFNKAYQEGHCQIILPVLRINDMMLTCVKDHTIRSLSLLVMKPTVVLCSTEHESISRKANDADVT